MGKYSDLLLSPAMEPEKPAQPTGKYSAQAFGTSPSVPEEASKPEGWGEWIVNSVKGRQDPAYQGVGSVFDQQDLRTPTTIGAMTLGASDAQLSDVLRSQLGDRFIRQEMDANDNPVLVFRGEDGRERKGYVNEPGLDRRDVARGIFGAAPLAAGAGVVGGLVKGASVPLQMLAQGATAGGVSVAGDIAQMPLGSEQGVELGKAGAMAAFGGAAPALSAAGSAVWRQFVTIPGLVDKTTGQLTAKGVEAAKKAGLDPSDLTPDLSEEFAKSYAQTGDEIAAAAQSETAGLDIPVTRGQITKRPYLLNKEEGMRRGLYGDRAEDIIRAQDDLQSARIEEAVRGGGPKSQGVGETINPSRGGETYIRPMGENIQGTLRDARQAAKVEESALWETGGVKDLAATDSALGTLRGAIGDALKDETAFTKTGESMAKLVGDFAEKKLPVSEAGGIQLKQVQTVDQMRRRLLSEMKTAEPGADARQAEMIYNAFNDWIGESAQKQLLAGDPLAAAQLVKARAFTREVREMFSPTNSGGKASPCARRMSKVLESADSGEGVINAIFGSQGSRGVNEGTVTALRQVKSALDRFAPADAAKQAWDDVRLAYWSRVTQDKGGKIVGPQALVSNLENAFKGQESVMRTLYTPDELRQMKRLLSAMKVVAYKPPNASGSGYTTLDGIKEMTGKLLNLIPGSGYVRAGLELTGVSGALGAKAAREAVSRSAPVVRPNLAPAVVAAGAPFARD